MWYGLKCLGTIATTSLFHQRTCLSSSCFDRGGIERRRGVAFVWTFEMMMVDRGVVTFLFKNKDKELWEVVKVLDNWDAAAASFGRHSARAFLLLWGASPHTPLPACATARYNYPYKLGTSLNNNNNNNKQDAKFQRRPSSLNNSKNTLDLTSTKLGLWYNTSMYYHRE